MKLDCNGTRPVKIGINTTIISEQQGKLFTGVEVSASSQCQQMALNGIDVRGSMDWLIAKASDRSAVGALQRQWLEDVRIYPMVYFCETRTLLHVKLAVKDVWLKASEPDHLYDLVKSIHVSNQTGAAPAGARPSARMFEKATGYGPAQGAFIEMGCYMWYYHPPFFRFSEVMREVYNIPAHVMLSAVLGFGGSTSAVISGTMQDSVASSLIVAVGRSKLQLNDARVTQNVGLAGTGVLALHN
jgi:hypothetical protein